MSGLRDLWGRALYKWMGHTIRHEQKRLARARRIREQVKATEPALDTEAAEQRLEVVKTSLK